MSTVISIDETGLIKNEVQLVTFIQSVSNTDFDASDTGFIRNERNVRSLSCKGAEM